MELYSSKPQDKTVGKDSVTLKQEHVDETEKCDQCDKTFVNNHGLRIHIGKTHTAKRKRSVVEVCDNKFNCTPCGFECDTKIALSYHNGSCTKRQKEFHDSRRLTPANKKAMRKVENPEDDCSEKPADRDIKTTPEVLTSEEFQKENIMEIDDKNKCDKCDFKSNEQYVLKQHKRDNHRELSVSVTPPPKKRKEPENDNEIEVEEVLKQMEGLDVKDDVRENKFQKDSKIPNRLTEILRLKGVNINDHIVIRVGGGGKCGVNCVSLHMAGSEHLSSEIRTNVNRHIIENWDVYKDSFEYPYNARVGGGNKVFNREEDLLIFLMEEVEEASAMWMTHVCMQAVSTMYNMHINILTTGISQQDTYICPRCKPSQNFETEEELKVHEKNEHNRFETAEEIEGRLQRVRWTELRPDQRLIENSPNEKAENLLLIHEDDIHYNMIVNKCSNIFMKASQQKGHVQENHHKDNVTIFGDKLPSADAQTWAQKAGDFCPGSEAKKTSEIKNKGEEKGWKTVAKRGSAKGKESQIFIVTTSNRFIHLPDQAENNDPIPEIQKINTHNCNICGIIFSSNKMVDDHKRKSHAPMKRNKDGEDKDNDKTYELIQEKKMHNDTKKELQALKSEYKSCKEELMSVQEEKDRLKIKVNDLKSIVDPSGKSEIHVIKDLDTQRLICDVCNYPFKTTNEKDKHVEKHKVQNINQDIKQTCSLCTLEFTSDIVFMKHIQNKHSSEFNCQECDFQAGSSSIILAKHMNLRHRREEDR